MAKKKVIVEGGGENLYYVSESNGTIYVYKGSVWGSDTQIGKVREMRDAIAVIENHAGRKIKSIG
ncbi:hypothetical protein [Porphyrobacter sp. ULC335]|uniref:hypothetical protein n=1 Tax=Porphyrobacter sp. ULC335 TaxID=2854260 RepID=UPI00221F6B55|nr:hypothetical protein [Porphyrobacter sp. ULC335]UYV16512.1 hypothetical protein KVF90_04080 [Porphyrobacter sp. ULC335]